MNDVAMCGADPQYVSVGLILEEGFSSASLSTILASMARAAENAGVKVVTGDTKVVPRGKVDKIFINTSGCGIFVSRGMCVRQQCPSRRSSDHQRYHC